MKIPKASKENSFFRLICILFFIIVHLYSTVFAILRQYWRNIANVGQYAPIFAVLDECCANIEHLYSPQQMVAITTYLQYKQWEKKRKKEHISINWQILSDQTSILFATREVFLHLLNSKCMLVLLYSLEVCPPNKADIGYGPLTSPSRAVWWNYSARVILI